MGIQKIGDTDPSKKLSTLGNAAYKRPYLLRHLTINHPNQVWSIDITYIPMQKGFMYLTAIIDIYSRCIVGWGLHNNLDKENCLEFSRKPLPDTALQKSSILIRVASSQVNYGLKHVKIMALRSV